MFSQIRNILIPFLRGRGGGGLQPYISHIGMCRPHRVRCLGRFGLETGLIHFTRFGLESGMVFEGTTESINVFIISIPNEKERKKEKYANSELETDLNNICVCAPN